ncbi:MAG TPA: BTAD domain-containing putative transcriptional regulator [Actinophytocola sp.]|uniref:AfsR/SARP family transcriptional regulator n=1 Tax=Actinophytocola sp. TaxID=1872138 RepID=UPI002DB69444|nr:BTAD domain-containing putative transcriptional regulator [Actinophytocola sp.]HEU5471977.1 BTAD domain-containing putative transcriptional regulator [Actinophytocola sp.]
MLKIGGPREQVVLAILALRVHRVASMDQLIDVVWADDPPPTARGQIQTSISALRKLLGDAGRPDAIKTRSSGYLLDIPDDDLDSTRFSSLIAAAHQQAAEGQLAAAAETMRSALNLWRGPACDGIQSDIVRNAASVLEESRLTATEELVRLELELGRHVDITGELQALIAEHPWRERLYGFLMLAMYRSGRQAEALEVYRRARTVLTNEVGIEPGQELRDLERAVLSGDPSLDLPEAGEEPATEQPSVIPRQLPSSIADFVGREDLLDEIRQILASGESTAPYAVPVVAISGRGGVGKSTLALRVAHELGDAFPDGHIYVDLQGVRDDESPLALLARFLRALGVRGSLMPDGLVERVEMYRSRLASKRLLLVLDDVTSEQQVIPLLPGSPSCAVLVTSRARLVGLPGASFIGIDTFDEATAAEFLARIVGRDRVEAEPMATTEVITYCGRLPLALRIAGARLVSRPHWRIGDLARRLKNEVRRLDELSHQGLAIRSSIGLTYRSLPEQAKRLFRLFAMIKVPDAPGWLAAALLDIELTEAEDLLERLVEAQMLDAVRDPVGQIRYRFHDLIRVYAQERLAESEKEDERRAALERVLSGWLALVENAHRKEYGGDYTILHGTAPRLRLAEWAYDDPIGHPMDWLENERICLVSAIQQAAAAGLDETCWDLALTAVSLFEVRGYLDDWRKTAELALATARRAGNRTGTAAMLYSRGSLHYNQKQLDDAAVMFAQALEMFEADGNLHGQALVLRNAANVDRLRGNFDAMLARYTDALAMMRTVGDLIGQASILTALARYEIDEGDFPEAQELLREALELCRTANYRRGEAHVVCRLAELYRRTGQLALSRKSLTDVLRTVRETGDRVGEAYVLYGLGMVRRDEGRLDAAEATLALALDLAERTGEQQVEGQSRYSLGEIAIVRVDNTTAARHLEKARELFSRLGAAIWMARTYILQLELHDAAGEAQQAQNVLEQAQNVLSGIDSKQSTQLLLQLEEMKSALLTEDISGQRG